VKRIVWISLALVIFSLPVSAQKTPEQLKASFTAHHSDFDYLLGDWEFTAEDQQYGKYHGVWSAARLGEGPQILDEFRVTGDQGETYALTSTLRAYNATLDRWELVSVDKGNGLQNFGTAVKVGDEMHIEQKFGYGTAKPVVMRIRYYNIRPDGFSWVADRSVDDGKTWTASFMKIEAHRVGPPRTLDPLTRASRTTSPAAGKSSSGNGKR
jgi:hypothetical protein